MPDFYNRVYELVRTVPAGRVATYGQIASLLGSPRSARMVGTALRSLPAGTDVPWHRVISSRGVVSIENMDHPQEEQANMLIAEGIEVHPVDGQFVVQLKRYLWRQEV